MFRRGREPRTKDSSSQYRIRPPKNDVGIQNPPPNVVAEINFGDPPNVAAKPYKCGVYMEIVSTKYFAFRKILLAGFDQWIMMLRV